MEVDPRFADNTYHSKGGTGDAYGAKAHRDLVVTRGKGFRKEKTKKKRNTFHGGGVIGGGVNSVAFHYSDDE